MFIQKYFIKFLFFLIVLFWGFWFSFSFATSTPSPAATKSQFTKEEFISFLSSLDISNSIIYGDYPLSRYELTRLLNAVECRDCIMPPVSIVETYTQPFWSSFIQLPWKDFRDIGFKNAPHEGKDYYYCVAYIGDKTYMRWYPLAIGAASPLRKPSLITRV